MKLGLLRYVWAFPATVLGLLFVPAAWLTRGRVDCVEGILEVQGGLVQRLLAHLPVIRGASAMTLGHVVLGQDQACLDLSRAHERVHVRQYERWGAFFLPAYLAASAWVSVTGRHAYWDNPFEREAYSEDLTRL